MLLAVPLVQLGTGEGILAWPRLGISVCMGVESIITSSKKHGLKKVMSAAFTAGAQVGSEFIYKKPQMVPK
jgi:hypothetical protein